MADSRCKDTACPCCGNKEVALASPAYTGCSCCGHRWRSPLMNDEVGYYEELKGRNDARSPWFRRKVSERIAALSSLIGPEVQRILEIGCAEGELGALIKERSPVIFDGVELSRDSQEAEKKLDRVFKTPASQVKAAPYDLIISFHVLEHIQLLEEEIASWRRLLSSGGKLLIEVPNQAGHPLLQTDKNPEHLHQFTPASLTVLLERNGFTCQSLSTGHYESPAYPDSIRVIAHPSLDDGSRRRLLVARFKERTGGPFIAYGIGGDFKNYVLPLIDELDIDGLADSSPAKWGMAFGGHRVGAFDPVDHDELPVLICSLKFCESIRRDLLSKGLEPKRLISLEDILGDPVV